MAHSEPPALCRAIRNWNRRIQQALDAGYALTDPQVVALSQALDRCIAAWYATDPDHGDAVSEGR